MKVKKSAATSDNSSSADHATLNGRAIGYSPALIASGVASAPSTLIALTVSSNEPNEIYPIA